jgi:hypothetical protein
MSRSIDICYRDKTIGSDTKIEIEAPYFLLGGQRSSKAFWNLPRLKEVGIERLSSLGVSDPVYFFGWEEMPLLDREIKLLQEHLASIDFPIEIKVRWLSNLIYCYHLLIESAPQTSMPIFGIG